MGKSIEIIGKIALLVSNDDSVNIFVQHMLETKGCSVSGPHLYFETALEAANADNFHIGILNRTIGGIRVDPIADLLAARDIPFIIASATPDKVRRERPEWIVLGKPLDARAFFDALDVAILRIPPPLSRQGPVSGALPIQRARIIERAFELAQSGSCAKVADIRARLKSDGFTAIEIEGHLRSRRLRSQLLKLCIDARAPDAGQTRDRHGDDDRGQHDLI